MEGIPLREVEGDEGVFGERDTCCKVCLLICRSQSEDVVGAGEDREAVVLRWVDERECTASEECCFCWQSEGLW